MADIRVRHEDQFNLVKGAMDTVVHRYVRTYNRAHERLRDTLMYASIFKRNPLFSAELHETMRTEVLAIYDRLSANGQVFNGYFTAMHNLLAQLRSTNGNLNSEHQRVQVIQQANNYRTQVDTLVNELNDIRDDILPSQQRIVPGYGHERAYVEPPISKVWFRVSQKPHDVDARTDWYNMAHQQLLQHMSKVVNEAIDELLPLEELNTKMVLFTHKWHHVLENQMPGEDYANLRNQLNEYTAFLQTCLPQITDYLEIPNQAPPIALQLNRAITETATIMEEATTNVMNTLEKFLTDFSKWGRTLRRGQQMTEELETMFEDFDKELRPYLAQHGPGEERIRFALDSCRPLGDG